MNIFSQLSDCLRYGAYYGKVKIDSIDSNKYEIFLPWKISLDSIAEFGFKCEDIKKENLKRFKVVEVFSYNLEYNTGALLGGLRCEQEKFLNAEKYRVIVFRNDKFYKEFIIDKNEIELTLNWDEKISLTIKMPTIDLTNKQIIENGKSD